MHLTTINKTLSVAVVSSYLYRVAVSANNSTIIQNARTLAECTLEKQKTRMAKAVEIGGKTELKIRDCQTRQRIPCNGRHAFIRIRVLNPAQMIFEEAILNRWLLALLAVG